MEKIIAQVEKNQTKDDNKNNHIINDEKSSEIDYTKEENIRLKNLVEILQKENAKIPKVKDLVQEYKDELEKKNEKIKALEDNIYYLQSQLNRIPKFIRRIFIKKDDVELLESGK